MRDVENEVRELLRERADDLRADPRIPERVVRRSRRRRGLVAGAAGLGAAAVVVVAVLAVRALAPRADDGAPATQTPSPAAKTWRGIWEYTSREDARAAQAGTDAGHMPWQADAEAFLRVYAYRDDGLGWGSVWFDDSLDLSDPDEPGPLTIHIGDCPDVATTGCPREADVTIERLVRRDRTGIWSVTAVSVVEIDDPIPSTFIGLRDGEVVLAETETGEVLAIIADRSVVGTPDPTLNPDFLDVAPALTPDRSAVYMAASREGVEGRRLVRVPLDGGDPQDLGWGDEPAVSPAGDRLAYRSCTPDGCGRALVILDLAAGGSTRVGLSQSELLVGGTVWLPDGRLAVLVLPPGDSPIEIRLVDPGAPPADLLDAAAVPDPEDGTARFGIYGLDGSTGGLVVGESCCRPTFQRQRFVAIDPDTGEVLRTVVRGGWWQVHPDVSGANLLLLDFRARVYVSRDGADPVLLAEGFSDVAW